MMQYPEEVEQYIKANYIGVGPKEMAELLNKTFGASYTRSQMKSYYGNHKLNSGVTGRFPKGNAPANKGKKGYCSPGSEKGWFKNGHAPHNHRPVGSERISKDGYAEVKIAEPKTWELKHKVLWESVNGKVPEGHVVTFLDGDKSNITIENLALITMAESLELTRSGLRSEVKEYTETGILITKVKIASRNVAKRRKG